MPYITQGNRPLMDSHIEYLLTEGLEDHELSYILYKFCEKYIVPSYNNYKNYLGELRQCTHEIERRMFIDRKEIKEFSIWNLKTLPKDRILLCNAKVEFMYATRIEVNGDLNYILYSLALRHCLDISTKVTTFKRKRICDELYRACYYIEDQLLNPYEDKKIGENGDIFL